MDISTEHWPNVVYWWNLSPCNKLSVQTETIKTIGGSCYSQIKESFRSDHESCKSHFRSPKFENPNLWLHQFELFIISFVPLLLIYPMWSQTLRAKFRISIALTNLFRRIIANPRWLLTINEKRLRWMNDSHSGILWNILIGLRHQKTEWENEHNKKVITHEFII